VEDVKTFFRILMMLFLVACVFYLQVHSLYVFPLFGIHLGRSKPIKDDGCQSHWILLQSGNLSYIIAIVTIPLYVIFLRSYVTRYFPHILSRLCVGVILIVASTSSIFIINTIASHVATTSHNNTNTCLFLADVRPHVRHHNHTFSQTLEFHTSVLFIPNLLTGVASPLICITILEFISAQSPHTMKGLLLGVFYAVRGFFIMSGCILVFPFSIKKY